MSGGAGTLGGAGAGAGAGGASAAGGSAGAAGLGGAAGAAGTAGANAGSSGSAGQGGGGGTSTASKSEGCGKGGRPSGGVVTVTNDHIYTFPTAYDGTTPYPLFIGMHAAGNPIEQFRNLTNGSEIETNMVRAFPKSAGNEWNFNNDLAKVTGMYDDLMANYCIDTSRVFSSGHSSGAQMIVQILANAAAAEHMNYKAVAPVAASRYGAIVSPIPVMYIQGENDSVRNSDGADVVARFTDVNGCDSTSMPFQAPTCTSGGVMVNPGCISYQGCSEPTIWCSHNDPQYSNTSHGVPCFAVDAMYDFFMGLP
jgi:predicted esterase